MNYEELIIFNEPGMAELKCVFLREGAIRLWVTPSLAFVCVQSGDMEALSGKWRFQKDEFIAEGCEGCFL